MVAQKHIIRGIEHWRPVNLTCRAWTSAEAGYGQIGRESNGILTGMYMNRMYTLGTYTKVITDHRPLEPSNSELTDIEQNYSPSGTVSNMSLENTCHVTTDQGIHHQLTYLPPKKGEDTLLKIKQTSQTESFKTCSHKLLH